MNRVYSVSAGAYSDYNVKCLFSTREDAERACEEIRKRGIQEYEGPFVEEFVYFEKDERPLQITVWNAYTRAPEWKAEVGRKETRWDFELPRVVENGVDPTCWIVTDDHKAAYDIRLVANSQARAADEIKEYARRRKAGDPVAELLH